VRERFLHKQANAEDEQLFVKTCSPRQPDAAGIILVLSHYSLSHTRFRSLANRLTGARIATMPTFLPAQLLGVMSADWTAVAQRSEVVAALLSAADTVTIHSGRDLVLELVVKGRQGLADGGLLTSPGMFGNLPGGEGFIAPVEGQAQGRFEAFATDGKSRLIFVVKQGNFVSVDPRSDPSVQSLYNLLPTVPEVANLAELGIGTNEKATDTANILEGEKILGTCHIAFGDNQGFGGVVSAPFHRDYIVPAPTLIMHFSDRAPVTLLDGGTWNV